MSPGILHSNCRSLRPVASRCRGDRGSSLVEFALVSLTFFLLVFLVIESGRLIFAYNPFRIDRGYIGPATGSPFFISEKKRDIKFTVGRTF